MINFIKNVYPRNKNDEWKNDLKIDIVSCKKNTIYILYLSLPKIGYEYNKRKSVIMYKGIDEFKKIIRAKFKSKINNYVFDNIFHMTDNEIEYYNLSALIDEYLTLKKRKNGRIQLSEKNFKLIIDRIERKKYKYNNWIFKEIRENSYEDYCELFCEEIFRRFNLPPAFYDLAILNNKNGVITYDFTKNKKYISANDLIGEIINSNNINDIMKYNNYDSLINILLIFCKKHNLNINNFNSLINNIKKMMIIDLLLLQSDRNPNNYGFIINGRVELSRIFDNSNAMSCNHIDRNPYNNKPILTENKLNNNFYEEMSNNVEFYKDVTKYIDYIENNLEDIFMNIENKINKKLPLKIKNYIINILNHHFSSIKNI